MKKKYALLPSMVLVPVLVSNVYASETSIGIYPPLTRITALPGAKVISPLTVVNSSESLKTFTIVLKGFRASDKNDGTVEYYPTKDTPQDLSSFLSSVTIQSEANVIKSIDLYPNEYKKLDIIFTAPEKQEADYYFSVVMQSSPENTQIDQNDTLTHISTGVATNVIVAMNSAQKANGTIADFSTQPFVVRGPAVFSLVAQNTSGKYAEVEGTIAIYNILGKKVGSIPLQPTLVLSDSERIMKTSTSQNQVEWGEKFIFGFYTAKAVLRFDKTHVVTEEIRFFAIPIVALVVITVILFVILSICLRILRKINFKER